MTERASAAKRGYDGRWRKARLAFLRAHPLCVMCKEQGYIVPASVVDHIRRHMGDPMLFWAQDNWQSLCKRHHDSAKQSEERRGAAIGCVPDGSPLDARHHWHMGHP